MPTTSKRLSTPAVRPQRRGLAGEGEADELIERTELARQNNEARLRMQRRIRQHRETRGWTHADLAERASQAWGRRRISAKMIAAIERGDAARASIGHYDAIAGVFGLKTGMLLAPDTGTPRTAAARRAQAIPPPESEGENTRAFVTVWKFLCQAAVCVECIAVRTGVPLDVVTGVMRRADWWGAQTQIRTQFIADFGTCVACGKGREPINGRSARDAQWIWRTR